MLKGDLFSKWILLANTWNLSTLPLTDQFSIKRQQEYPWLTVYKAQLTLFRVHIITLYHFISLSSEEDLAYYGADWDGPAPSAFWSGPLGDEELSVEVPQLPTRLQPNERIQLSWIVNLLHQSGDSGVDLYLQALQFISSCTQEG